MPSPPIRTPVRPPPRIPIRRGKREVFELGLVYWFDKNAIVFSNDYLGEPQDEKNNPSLIEPFVRNNTLKKSLISLIKLCKKTND